RAQMCYEGLTTGEVGVAEKGQAEGGAVLSGGRWTGIGKQSEFLSAFPKQVTELDAKVGTWQVTALLPAFDGRYSGAELVSQVLLPPVAANPFLAQGGDRGSVMRPIHKSLSFSLFREADQVQ